MNKTCQEKREVGEACNDWKIPGEKLERKVKKQKSQWIYQVAWTESSI